MDNKQQSPILTLAHLFLFVIGRANFFVSFLSKFPKQPRTQSVSPFMGELRERERENRGKEEKELLV